MATRILWSVLASAAVACAIFAGITPQNASLQATFNDWLEHPAIRYDKTDVMDPVAQLNRKIQMGQVTLKPEGESGYLRSLLEALKVPLTSQVVVFIKDSAQARLIEPQNPRTIFFNDSVAVGWVRGGFIEIASQDPRQGTVFYTLDPRDEITAPVRSDNTCVNCHYNRSTSSVPGMMVRSVGQPKVDQSTPLDQRWGGWYVTGQLGAIAHLGNIEVDRIYDSQRPSGTAGVLSLKDKFDAGYLALSSDVAALMVFEHQMHMMNLLARIGWDARVAEHQPKTRADSLITLVSLREAAEEVVDYMLFIDETPIPNKIQGSTSFAADFAARGPHDRKGRSLRQLALDQRLMRFPCSYMIYSAQFDALPGKVREAIYARLWQILSGQEKDEKYSRLSSADRLAIVEILRDTKKDLPSYWR